MIGYLCNDSVALFISLGLMVLWYLIALGNPAWDLADLDLLYYGMYVVFVIASISALHIQTIKGNIHIL